MERIITPDEILEDGNGELSLRPQKINEYIGQDKVKERLNIFNNSCMQIYSILFKPHGNELCPIIHRAYFYCD